MSQRMKLFIFPADHKSDRGCVLSDLELYPQKRKNRKCMDEGSYDAFMSGDRSCVCIPVIPAF